MPHYPEYTYHDGVVSSSLHFLFRFVESHSIPVEHFRGELSSLSLEIAGTLSLEKMKRIIVFRSNILTYTGNRSEKLNQNLWLSTVTRYADHLHICMYNSRQPSNTSCTKYWVHVIARCITTRTYHKT